MCALRTCTGGSGLLLLFPRGIVCALLLRDLRSQPLNFGGDLRVVTIFLGQLCLERRLLSLACTQKVAMLLCVGILLLLLHA